MPTEVDNTKTDEQIVVEEPSENVECLKPAKQVNDSVEEAEKTSAVPDVSKVEEKFQEGKRQFICGDYCDSVKILSEVCEEMVEIHGQMDTKIADVYYQYGCALLEVAKMESNVLTGALEGVEEDEEKKEGEVENGEEQNGKMDIIDEEPITEDQEEDIAEKVIDAMCSEEKEADKDANAETKESPAKEVETKDKNGTEASEQKSANGNGVSGEAVKDTENITVEKVKSDEENKTEESENNGDDKTKESSEKESGEACDSKEDGSDKEEMEADEQSNDEEESGEGEEEEEEVTNLQLAWEMVELARVIYSKQLDDLDAEDTTDEGKTQRRKVLLNLSDVYIKLSDIGTEQGLYTQATTDADNAIAKMKLAMDLVKLPESSAFGEKLSIVSDYRELTELFFKKSLSQGLDNLYSDARTSITECNNLLRKAIVICKESLESINDSEDSSKSKFEKHIVDMESLIPELMEKHDDWLDEEKNKESTKEQIKQTLSKAINGKGDNEAEATKDITHLVRKKRTSDGGAENGSESSEPQTKKVKLDEKEAE